MASPMAEPMRRPSTLLWYWSRERDGRKDVAVGDVIVSGEAAALGDDVSQPVEQTNARRSAAGITFMAANDGTERVGVDACLGSSRLRPDFPATDGFVAEIHSTGPT